MQHHPHHSQQGPPPPHHLSQQSRPSSIVHQHHQQQQVPPQQSQHSNPYPASHLPQYAQSGAPGAGGQHPQELPYYTSNSHPSPYSTPSATGTYSSAAPDTPDIMAAAQMTRPYPPISYHTPQSNSPASVASPSGHDQHRIYAPTSQLQQNPQMYYGGPQQQQYPQLPPQNAPSYAPHPQQQQQHHQSMTSQPNLLMSHTPSQQHQMQQHPGQQQHAQQAMSGSPRTKIEPHVPQIPRPSAPLGPPQQQQQQQHPANGPPMQQNGAPNAGNAGVNPNAAPGPIPATTPLVVRQDNNGVQWIAFEYSRDRVKMEYTIRCDVESVNVDTLTPEFKTENCVYPRACCSKDQYRGNRLIYENECNTVGWALAELNPCLRGKRGLIQRAVDSWRNSNQDPRLRSRRVRRMAKINNRKAVQAPQPPHMPGPSGPPGMPPSGHMGPGGASSMGKPSLSGMGGPQLHHHHNHPDGSTGGGGDDVAGGHCKELLQCCFEQLEEIFMYTYYLIGLLAWDFSLAMGVGITSTTTHTTSQSHVSMYNYNDGYMDEDSQHHHHHQAPPGAPNSAVPQDSIRDSHNFHGYAGASSYPPLPNLTGASMPPSTSMHASPHPPHPISVRGTHTKSHAKGGEEMAEEERLSLFGDIPEAKKRKFILVDDPGKGGRVRVRVTLDTVDTDEIPDSFRKSNSVFPRSWFPIQMQSPPPSAHGSRFFTELDDDDTVETEGRGMRGRGARKGKQMVSVLLSVGGDVEVGVPRMRKSVRIKEVKLNDLGYRMTWHQSRVFADKTVFLQKALDSYRNKVRSTMEQTGKDVAAIAPHFETRVGKRLWNDRSKRERTSDDS
ncbi:ribosomal protein L24E [Drepanopeziza brunnea f. sp. 'multigermtubi' MB_m1]|uniref:Ribosomal protein L24E n=1 Tax=Marssonina brunnea f. sp. multigermtubi (strain MB_m1) TaxID=1072389 RepID=K1XX61_MARBU|nr:ribosomal protein L24E [Drepanopeziza brunnea f. sp. 'multigermtubi' MB_m1]EKD17364.1 ribosomal protein L24E [Drepanopeziza brunnea f. sp. 'multigermtubi' MB_m1]